MFKKTGKLFGNISVVDIGAILIVALLVVGVYIKFSGTGNIQLSNASQELQCVLKVESVRNYTVEALKKSESVFNKTTKERLGDIVDIKVEPGTTMLLMENGDYREVETEGRYDVYLTVDFKGKDATDGYYTGSNTQMSSGATLGITTKYSECNAKIESVSKK